MRRVSSTLLPLRPHHLVGSLAMFGPPPRPRPALTVHNARPRVLPAVHRYVLAFPISFSVSPDVKKPTHDNPYVER